MGLALGSTVPWRKAVIRVGNLPAQKVCDAAVPGGVGRLALEAEALQNSLCGGEDKSLAVGVGKDNKVVCSSAGSAKCMESSVRR